VHQVGFCLHEGWKYLCDKFYVLHYLANVTRIRILVFEKVSCVAGTYYRLHNITFQKARNLGKNVVEIKILSLLG